MKIAITPQEHKDLYKVLLDSFNPHMGLMTYFHLRNEGIRRGWSLTQEGCVLLLAIKKINNAKEEFAFVESIYPILGKESEDPQEVELSLYDSMKINLRKVGVQLEYPLYFKDPREDSQGNRLKMSAFNPSFLIENWK